MASCTYFNIYLPHCPTVIRPVCLLTTSSSFSGEGTVFDTSNASPIESSQPVFLKLGMACFVYHVLSAQLYAWLSRDA